MLKWHLHGKKAISDVHDYNFLGKMAESIDLTVIWMV